jgi:peptidoglycan/xylan/chitin deacetylase (PgdA/CDA1 family)
MRGKRQAILLWLLLALLLPSDWGAMEAVDAPLTLQEEIRYVALTFDDGPKEGTTDVLLDGLKERGAAATFFLVGDQAVLYPDLVRRMQQEGHQVGNHTWSHRRLEGDREQALHQVERMDGLLREILGDGSYWLRPPYGVIEESLLSAIPVPMVKWDLDPRDWEHRDTEIVVQAILSKVKANSIILLHDIYPTSVEAALQVIDILQEEGYWFVTVEELLRINAVTPVPGVMYRSGA